jgi:hypothetical protein
MSTDESKLSVIFTKRRGEDHFAFVLLLTYRNVLKGIVTA